MSNRLSLLQRPQKVHLDPYPHMIIDNCLPENIYLELLETRPGAEWILSGRDPGDNKRIDLCAAQCLQRELPTIWREFILYHLSNDFWLEVKELFGDYIRLAYPQLHMHGLLDIEPGIRHATDKPFFMDVNIGVNTPCLTEGSVRGSHLDNSMELFAGLLYQGAGEGGDLVVGRIVKPPKFFGKLEIEEDCVEPVKVVKYRHNQFVMFLNTPLSVHSVTPRDSKDYRKLVNIIGEYQFPLFKVQR